MTAVTGNPAFGAYRLHEVPRARFSKLHLSAAEPRGCVRSIAFGVQSVVSQNLTQ